MEVSRHQILRIFNKPETIFLWKLMLGNMKNKNPVDNDGYSILHHFALCYPNETEKFSKQNSKKKRRWTLDATFLGAGL